MLRKKNRSLIFLSLGLILLATLDLFSSKLLLPLDNKLADVLVSAKSQSSPADQDIVLIDIDETSLHEMSSIAGSWPWPRSVYAEVLEGLAPQNPKAVVFDILFSEPDIYRAESDQYLNQVLLQMDNVFLPMLRMQADKKNAGIPLAKYGALLGIIPGERAVEAAHANLLLPYALDERTWKPGVINFLGDEADGIGRRYYVYLDEQGWKIPSLPARVVSDLGYSLPAKTETIILKWPRGLIPYPKISFSTLYMDQQRETPQRSKEEFTGKIVIIGTTASGLHDLRHTPLSSVHPALSILATAIDNLKNGEALYQIPQLINWFGTLVAIGALLLFFIRRQSPLAIVGVFFPASLFLVAASYALLFIDIQFHVVTPLVFSWCFFLIAALHAFLQERRARQHTVDTFSRFLDPTVVEDLIAEGQTTETLSGDDRDVTVLFSDIRGFTTLSEQHSASQIVAILNAYFSRQVDVIFKHGGTLDKFIGDAVMAFWGAPRADEKHAENAVRAALEMSQELNAFKKEMGKLGETFDIGIGVHTGPAVVGFIGSDRRQDYTAIGDTVNLASRIEGLTKGVCRVMISEDTYNQCKNSFDFTAHGSYKVKGREKEVKIFEPRGLNT